MFAARLAGLLSRLSGRGGSSLPGLIARRIDRKVLSRLSQKLARRTVLITGTNGKTTTAALTARLLQTKDHTVLHNRAGANLILGLTATFVQSHMWRIFPRADTAVLETDEATMPRASLEIRPGLIAVTNFFRDQLDRYGELSTTIDFVARGIANLSDEGLLVLNADDPQVAYLGYGRRNALYYGVDLAADHASSVDGYDVVDARYCPNCGNVLSYSMRYYAHIGHYRCSECSFERPTPSITVKKWDRELKQIETWLDDEPMTLPNPMPGIYNLYNHLAAIAIARAFGVPRSSIVDAMQHFEPAFGRMERIEAYGHNMWLALVKNPVGFNQVLSAVFEDPHPKILMLAINDRYADGQDVSWLWDVDFERFAHSGVHQWWVSGVRAQDMRVRLKYAGINPENIVMEPVISRAVDAVLHQETTDTIYAMPTYTALLEMRKHLTEEGLTRHFREG